VPPAGQWFTRSDLKLVDQAARSINLSCPANAKAPDQLRTREINLKTATAVSPDVLVTLLRADEVIE
jgi:hypothetical protein